MTPPASWPGGGHPGEALSALADGELAASERAAVAAHVERCRQCASELRGVRAIRDAVRALPPVEPPPGFADRLVAELGRRAGPRRRPALLGAAAAVTAAALLLLVPSLMGLGRYRPEVQQALLRHVASVSALAAVGSTTADGASHLTLSPPVTPSTAVPREVEDLPAPYLAPSQLAGGYRLVDAFAHPDGVQLVYDRGRYALSVFETPGELDPAGLPPGGRPVQGETAMWRWEADGVAGRVVVLERDGMVVTVVGDEPGDAVLSAARSVPEARPLSAVQRLRRAAAQLLRELSPSSTPARPPAAA